MKHAALVIVCMIIGAPIVLVLSVCIACAGWVADELA